MAEERWERRRTSFGREAAAYAYGRPSYPDEALRWALPPHATRVLDLGAGTGKLTAALLRLGLDVVAVEPLDEMRELIPPEAEVVVGHAESIPLADCSVDAVVAGQAFHWFDPKRAIPEMARVLRPGGSIGLLWNFSDDRVDWVAQLCDLTQSEARATLIEDDEDLEFPHSPLLARPERCLFEHTERYDADRLVAMIASWSLSILLTPEDRERVLDGVRKLAPSTVFDYPFVCVCWRCERR